MLQLNFASEQIASVACRLKPKQMRSFVQNEFFHGDQALLLCFEPAVLPRLACAQ